MRCQGSGRSIARQGAAAGRVHCTKQGVRLSRLGCRRLQMGQPSAATAKREKRQHHLWCVAGRAIRPGYDNHAPPANEGRWPNRRRPERESARESCV